MSLATIESSILIRTSILKTVVACTVLTISAAALADGPPLKILVGYAAGGGSDQLARLLGESMSKTLNRPVIVENKPGAGGRIAAAALKMAPSDGSVVMVAPNGLTSIQAIVYKDQLQYDPAKDLVPVAKLVDTVLAITVSGKLQINDAKQFSAWVKANPTKANYGSPGAGGMPHFVGLMLANAIGTPMNHVAYRGGGPVALALLGGEIPMGVSTMEDFAEHQKTGALRIIGITNAKRSSLAPDLPTMMEQGINFKAESWSAMWTNAGTPPQKIKEIADAAHKALQDPAIKAKLAVTGSDPAFADAQELGKLQAAEWKAWTPVIEASGFKPGN